jgi:hypothetical protein
MTYLFSMAAFIVAHPQPVKPCPFKTETYSEIPSSVTAWFGGFPGLIRRGGRDRGHPGSRASLRNHQVTALDLPAQECRSYGEPGADGG